MDILDFYTLPQKALVTVTPRDIPDKSLVTKTLKEASRFCRSIGKDIIFIYVDAPHMTLTVNDIAKLSDKQLKKVGLKRI